MELLNQYVIHKILGRGKIVKQNESYIWVQFSSKESHFQVPAAFKKHLVLEDETLQAAIISELAEKKAAEAAARQPIKYDPPVSKPEAQSPKPKTTVLPKAKQIKSRVEGQLLTYLVFQGSTYDEERQGGFIWAPKHNAGGHKCHHWDRLQDVKKGDIIFHCSGGYIRAISKATSDCKDADNPHHKDFDVIWSQWEKDGRQVDCEYTPVRHPIKHGDYKDTILKYCGVKYAPFDKDGNGNMGYLFDLAPELARFFLEKSMANNPDLRSVDYLQPLVSQM